MISREHQALLATFWKEFTVIYPGPIMSAKAEKTAGSRLNPGALEIADAAKLLSKVSGQTVSAAMIEEDIECGAPVNANGTLNLIHYAAWLIKEMAHGD